MKTLSFVLFLAGTMALVFMLLARFALENSGGSHVPLSAILGHDEYNLVIALFMASIAAKAQADRPA